MVVRLHTSLGGSLADLMGTTRLLAGKVKGDVSVLNMLSNCIA